MGYSISKINNAINILKNYDNTNPYVSYIKECNDKGYRVLSDFDVRYINENYNFKPILINKTYKITDWFGTKISETLKLDFIPEKLYIMTVIGIIGETLHCYVRYRKSVKEPTLIYLPKKAIYGDVFEKDYNDIAISFDDINKMTESIGRKLKKHQEDAVKFLLSRKKAILADEQGLGKEIDVNTILPTPVGYRKADDINVGDSLFGSDGKPHKVIGKYYQGLKDIYEITFSDGVKCNCGLEHLWIVRENSGEWKTLSLKEILDDKLYSLKYEIPLCSPVEFDDNSCVNDPYEYGRKYFSNDSDEFDYSYLNTTVENRIELLNGFVKNFSKEHIEGSYVITTNENKLSRLKEVVYSLGGYVNQYSKGELFYAIVHFLDKKDENIHKRFFYDIKLDRKSNAVCFEVDSDDHSFLTENYIVTHNTTSAIVASIKGNYNKVLIICPASLKGTWNRELKYYINEDEIGIVNGKKWVDKKYTIINYDIIQNFYEIPLEQEMEEKEFIDEKGKKLIKLVPAFKTKKNGEVEPKMRKTTKKSIVEKCMSNSKLYNAGFDLIIIDEIQKLANNTSNRYKVLDDFLKRSKPKGVFCITGTPLTNRPLNLYHILKLINADIVKDYDYYMDRFCDSKKIKKKDGTEIRINDGASNLDELREKIKGLYIRRLQKDIPGMVKKTIFTRYYSLPFEDEIEYNRLWNEYIDSQNKLDVYEAEKYRDLIEGGLVRRFLAEKMVKNTIELADEFIEDGQKVMIVCCFDNEVKAFKEYYKDSAVVYDGKKTNKQKDKAEYEFMNNPKKKVFIGQIIASGVGITLTKSHICIFNSFSWVPSDNWQVMDRIHRLSQTEDVSVYYQLFDDEKTIGMWNKIMSKERIIKNVIKSESEK